MARYLGVDLLTADQAPGGAALNLATASPRSGKVLLPEAVSVHLVAGARIAIVRGVEADSCEGVMALAPELVNRALDLIAAGNGPRHVLASVETEYVAWWEHAGETMLRIVVTPTVGLSQTATATATNVQGEVVSPTPTPSPDWHPSMRYFRMSQVTEDMYDAFRNVYLALESILSEIQPVQSNGKGKPEGEGVWVRRALARAATVVDFNRYAPAGHGPDLVQAVVDELYVRIRTSIFHAKNGRPVLLPQDAAHRETVANALERYVRLYIDLSHEVQGVSYPSGVMTAAGFAFFFTPAVEDLTIYATEDELLLHDNDQRVSLNPSRTVTLATAHAPDLDRPMFLAVLGDSPVRDVTSKIGSVRGLIALDSGGALASSAALDDGPIEIGGFDRLQCVMGIRGVNQELPKSSYAT